jgi:hypothetical protein
VAFSNDDVVRNDVIKEILRMYNWKHVVSGSRVPEFF